MERILQAEQKVYFSWTGSDSFIGSVVKISFKLLIKNKHVSAAGLQLSASVLIGVICGLALL